MLRQKIFLPGENEGKIWWSLHVDTLSQSQLAFRGKHVCWLLSFLRKSPKNVRLNVVIQFRTKSFCGEILDIKRMGFAKKVMHDSFFKCKLVAPLCLNMYLLFSIFSPLPETFGASKEITASIWWSFRVTTQVAAKQLPQLGHTAFWLLCYKVYSF